MITENENKTKSLITENSAIIPDFSVFHRIREERAIQAEEEVAKAENGPTPSETNVASLTSHPGWIEVAKHITDRIVALQTGVQAAIANGSSFTEIGQRAVVAKMAEEELEGVLNFVKAREKYVQENKH